MRASGGVSGRWVRAGLSKSNGVEQYGTFGNSHHASIDRH